MPRFGYHIDQPLAMIPYRLSALNAVVFQTMLRDPMRLSKEGIPDLEDQEGYRIAVAQCLLAAQPSTVSSEPLWGMVHASLLTNLASPDPRIRHGSINALVGDANLAVSLGLEGVCFHGGYQKGYTDRREALKVLTAKIVDVIAKLQPGARVWLENSCEGTELCQSIEEIGSVFRAVGGDPNQFGLVIDTCHLHVAGFDLAEESAPERLADTLDAQGLTPYLRVLHLNDAIEECGSHRDRHAIPGEGTIGAGLLGLCAHPLFAPLPAILELGTEAARSGIAYMQGESVS